MSWSPSSANITTTVAWTTNTPMPACTNTPSRSPRRTPDDPRHPAQEHVGRELEAGAVHRRGEDRQQRGQHHRDARVEQHRHDHRHRGQRERVGQDVAARGDLEREHRHQQQQADQQQHVVAVPELAPEPPGPGQQDGDHEDRQHDEADQPRDVEAALVELEPLDRLPGDGVDPVAAPDDRLAALPRLRDVDDALRGPGLGGVGGLGGERGVGDDERADQRGAQRRLGAGQVAREPAPDPVADRGHLGVLELGALGGVEDTRGLRADRGPTLGGQRLEGLAVVARDLAGQDVGEERRAELLGDPVAEGGVDRRDVALELAQLLRRDRGAAGDREVVLGVDVGARRVAGPLGQDLADVPLGARRLDARRGGLAHLEGGLRGRDVETQDQRHRRGQQDGGQDQPAGVTAGELAGGLRGSGEHGGRRSPAP